MKEKKAKHEFAYDHEKNFSFFTNTEVVHGFSTTDTGNMLIGSHKGAEKDEDRFLTIVSLKNRRR